MHEERKGEEGENEGGRGGERREEEGEGGGEKERKACVNYHYSFILAYHCIYSPCL